LTFRDHARLRDLDWGHRNRSVRLSAGREIAAAAVGFLPLSLVLPLLPLLPLLLLLQLFDAAVVSCIRG
jgi:hypothetical protein